MSEEWGPWIEHDGKPAPYLAGFWVEGDEQVGRLMGGGDLAATWVTREQWRVTDGLGRSWDWSNWPLYTRILRYRIRKPRGMTILEELIADLPQPATEKETA